MGSITIDISGGSPMDDLRVVQQLYGAITGLLLGGDGLEQEICAELTGTIDLISSVCIDNIEYQQKINQEEQTQELISIMNELADLNQFVDDKLFMKWFISSAGSDQPFSAFTVKSLIDNFKFWHAAYLNTQVVDHG